MITYSGASICLDSGAPTPKDLAVQLMRESRYVGSTKEFWPVGAHILVMAGMVRPGSILRLDIFLHEVDELYFGDVPGPCKLPSIKYYADKVLHRFYNDYGIAPPCGARVRVVKYWDVAARFSEMRVLFGSEGASRDRYREAWKEENLFPALDKEVLRMARLVRTTGRPLSARGPLVRRYEMELIKALGEHRQTSEKRLVKAEGTEAEAEAQVRS